MRGGEGEISAPPPNSRCLSSHQPVRGGRAAARGQSVELGSPYVISDQPKNIPGADLRGGRRARTCSSVPMPDMCSFLAMVARVLREMVLWK